MELRPGELHELRVGVEKLKAKRIFQEELLTLGSRLGRFLLPGEARALFLGALSALGEREGIRLRLVILDSELAALPWEYAHVHPPTDDRRISPFLVLDPRVSMVRHEAQATPLPSLRPDRPNEFRLVTAVTSEIEGYEPLNIDPRAIERALGEAVVDGVAMRFIPVEDPATPHSIREALGQPADAFQFDGHSVGPENGTSGGLVLAADRENRRAEILTPEELASLLKNAKVRLATLNSCDSASRGRRDDGVAAALVRAGVPAVVAMQHRIDNDHAVAFAKGLYAGIAAGLSLDEAVALGRRKILDLGVLLDWGVPVVYMRADGIIFPERTGVAEEAAKAFRAEISNRPLDLTEGLLRERAGDWSGASEQYKILLAGTNSERDKAILHLRLGSCSWRRGRVDEAEEQLAAAMRFPGALTDDILAGEILVEQSRVATMLGNWTTAENRAKQASQRFANVPSQQVAVELLLIWIKCQRGELNNAYERLHAIDRQVLNDELTVEYFDVLGQVQLARGEYSAAVESLKSALELDEKVNTQFQAGRSRLLLAEAHLRSGDRRDAKRQIDKVLAVYEEVQDEHELAKAWELLGEFHEDAGEYDEALRAYRQASAYDTAGRDARGEAHAHRHLGRVAHKQGDIERAQEYFERAHELLFRSEDKVEIIALLTEEAHLSLDKGDYEKAINKFQRALEMAEEEENERAVAVAQRNLAIALRKRGNLSDSEALLRKARPILEQREDWREVEPLLDELGEVLLDQGRYEEAIECLEESYRLDEILQTTHEKGRSLILLGRAHLCVGKRGKARDYLKGALDVFSDIEDKVGMSDALFELGRWYLDEGKSREALHNFRQGLEIDRRQEDRLGIVRANRAMASVYRRNGNWLRAEEHLEDAKSHLRSTPDPMERALLTQEQAQLSLARGEIHEAITTLEGAEREFERLGSVVRVADCKRLIGKALAQQGDCDRALVLLGQARHVFKEHKALIEENEVLDDLAEVYLLQNDLENARTAVEASLAMDQEADWRSGQGHSRLLLGQIEDQAGRVEAGRAEYQRALHAFEDAEDEVGQAEARLLLGDWYLKHASSFGESLDQAVHEYRTARRLYQAHQDPRGMSRAFQKLGEVYLRRGELQRAEEALDQGEDCLRGIKNAHDRAPLAFEQGILYASSNRHDRAIECFERAVDLYRELHREDKVHEALRRLATSYHTTGNFEKALYYMHQIDLEQIRIWSALLNNLHTEVATAAIQPYRSGRYDEAVRSAVNAIEPMVASQGASAASKVVDFCRSSIEFLREFHADSEGRKGVDSLAAIAVAHLIASELDKKEPPLPEPGTTG